MKQRQLVIGWAGIGLLLAFSLVALAGYATFGRHPEWLAGLGERSQAVYAVAFGFFSQAQVWLAGTVLAVILAGYAGWRWLPALAAVYALSLASELAGTTWGVPFGAYRYTELLGPQWLSRVPVVIPLSWFTMALPSFGLALALLPRSGAALRVLLGSFLLLVWDLSLDPAMSYATKYWVWGESGAYYGMPLLNLAGWYVTGVVLMLALWAGRAQEWLAAVPVRLLGGYYGANLALPLGMCVAAGLYGAALLSVLVLGVIGYATSASAARAALEPLRVRA